MTAMKPSFLFIIADDLNAWIGALGRHPQVRTPNIDALAREGVLFENAYCSAPYCNASRMGIFTGQLPATLGVYQNEDFWNTPSRPPTLIEQLRAADYHTYGAGKVFHGVYEYGIAGAAGDLYAQWREIENRRHLWTDYAVDTADPLPAARPMNGLFDFSKFSTVPQVYHHFDWGPLPPDREHELPDVNTTNAIKAFLEHPPRQPFFCAAGLYKPHLPWHVPRRFFDLYPLDDIVVPIVQDNLEGIPESGREWALTPADHELVTSRGVWKEAVRGYLACISFADSLVGDIVKAARESPAAENLTIILCGDNGFHLGEKLHWRKFALWEEATRVPLIFSGPGIQQGLRVAEPVSLIDVHPTILSAAGIRSAHSAAQSDGLPLPRVIAGAPRERPVIMTWGRGNHSVRTKRWRYIHYANGGQELYDHNADPMEFHNLAASPDYCDLIRMLAREISNQCGRWEAAV